MSGLRKPTRGLAFCGILFLLTFILPASFGWAADESADESTDEAKSEVQGPVPAFTEHSFKKKRNDNVFFDIAYPVFGIPYLDKVVQGSVANFLSGDGGKPERLRLPPPPPDGPRAWSRMFGYNIYAPKKGIVSLSFPTWYYDQDMFHGNIGSWAGTGTYDLERQKRLTLGDVFPYRSLAREKLPKLYAKALEDGPGADRCRWNSLDFGPDSKIWEDTGFLLTPDGITLVFSGQPPDLLDCEFIEIGKRDLPQAGADLGLWR